MSTYISEYRREQQLSSVRLVSNSNISGTYSNGEGNNGVGATITTASSSLTIDSVATVNGNRVLLLNQTNTYENGIYEVSGVGSVVVLTRSDDFQSSEQMKPGYYVPVEAGTVFAGACFTVVEPQVNIVGTDAITFTDNSSNPTSVNLVNSGLNIYNPAGTFLNHILFNSAISADRNFTVTTGDAARTIDVSAANLTLSAYGATLIDDASALAALTTLGIKRGTTAAYGGGGTSNAFTATGLLATDIVVANILASTNAVAIAKAVPTANTLTITFSADPGAGTTVNWIALPTV